MAGEPRISAASPRKRIWSRVLEARRTRSWEKDSGSGQIEGTFGVKRQGSLAGLGVDPRTDPGGSEDRPWWLCGLRKPLGGLRAQRGGRVRVARRDRGLRGGR